MYYFTNLILNLIIMVVCVVSSAEEGLFDYKPSNVPHEKNWQSVVGIFSNNHGGGSGVILDVDQNEGKLIILTVSHLAYDPKQLASFLVYKNRIGDVDERDAIASKLKIIKSDIDLDLALLSADLTMQATELEESKVDCSLTNMGSALLGIGFSAPGLRTPSRPELFPNPEQWVKRWSKGTAKKEIGEYLITTVDILSGASGGGVFDQQGNLVSIITGSKDGQVKKYSDDLSGAIGPSCSEAKKFIERYMNKRK